jgi:hypothetical protein
VELVANGRPNGPAPYFFERRENMKTMLYGYAYLASMGFLASMLLKLV